MKSKVNVTIDADSSAQDHGNELSEVRDDLQRHTRNAMKTLRGADLVARGREFEAQLGVRHTEAGGLIALLCNELESVGRFAAHLATEAVGRRCELTALAGDVDRDGRCTGAAVAVRWADGFADDVCELHAERVRDDGAMVICPLRHNGEIATPT